MHNIKVFIPLKELLSFLKHNLFIVALILIGSAIALSFIFPNGDIRCVKEVCGLYIGQWHLHDAMWHIALVETAFDKYPFQNPIYSGAPLIGYNFLMDLVIFLLSKTGLSSIFIFFKLLPIIYCALFAFFILQYAIIQKKSTLYIACLIFFSYFGASMTYLLTFFHKGDIGLSVLRGFPVVSSIQPGTIFLNLQFAFTLIIFLYTLLLLRSKILFKKIILLSLLLFICTGLKFYGGILMLIMIGLYETFELFQSKEILKFLSHIIVYFISFLLSIVLFYNPFAPSTQSGSPFSFEPFALLHTIIEDPNLFYLRNLTLARYYLYENGISPRLLAIEGMTVVLFLIINYGTRLFGLLYVTKQVILKKLSKEDFILLLIILISSVIPILFVQKGVWFNSIQFIYYGVFFMNFFAAKFLYELLKSKKIISIVFAFIVVLLTIPNSIEQIRFAYIPQRVITNQELDALIYLKKLPPGAVFTLPAVGETAYVSALSAHHVFIASTQILDNTGVDFTDRLKSLENPATFDVDKHSIRYYYLRKDDGQFKIYSDKLSTNKRFKKVFDNSTVTIYSLR